MGAELVDSSGKKNLLQIYEHQTPAFRRLCDDARVDFEVVMQFLRKEHAYSKLIFGSIDFDNLDNVARMAWMLGIRFDVGRIEYLASQLSVSGTQLLLPNHAAADVALWMELRRQAYEVLIYDPPTVAAQAVLSSVIETALSSGTLEAGDWHYDDHSLLAALGRDPAAKLMLSRDYYKDLPGLVLIYREVDAPHLLWSRGRKALTDLLVKFMKERVGAKGGTYGYAFRDKGAFSKKLDFVDPDSGHQWSTGETSDSLILYGFSKHGSATAPNPHDLGLEFRNWLERH
jgi:hypothetical protein